MTTRQLGKSSLKREAGMARPREITVEKLNEEVGVKGIDVIERDVNPNYVHIRFRSCQHTKKIPITSLRKNTPFCEVCYENNLKTILDKQGFYLLAKKSGGNRYASKTRYSQRLVACKECGYWRIIIPENSDKFRLRCHYCQRIQAEKYVPDDFLLVDRADNNYLILQHRSCGSFFTSQLSNLKRYTPRCPSCERVITKSFVYLIKINISDDVSILKVGKSNNPYLRSLSIGVDPAKIEFICDMKFESEDDAFLFEKKIHKLFSDYNLSPDECRKYLSSGFTECYPVSILDKIQKEFQNDQTHVYDE